MNLAVRAALPTLCLLALSTPILPAQTTDTTPPDGAARVSGALATPSVRAARAEAAVHVDGSLDEAAWATAEVADGFVQQWPHEGRPASDATEVRVLFDASALYVGARMRAPADSVVAQLARRDASGIFSDWFHVVVDSYHDRRTAFRFAVNPAGVQKDVYHFNDGQEDLGWDAVWESATARTEEGWTAELRIPLSQLRYNAVPRGAERVWGIQFVRDAAARDERSTWSPIPNNYNGFVSRSGDLRGLVDLGAPRRVELLPYTSARVDRVPGDADDPFHEATGLSGSVGADLKLGLPAGLTLTGTVNPDFGQVEVDPAVVNLSAFETFYPEKRPFFLEGADVFRFGRTQAFNTYGFTEFFYSRRVGRAPQLEVDADFADVPDQSTILGAAKVTGKTPSGWTVGLMDAVTAREEAPFGDSLGVHGRAPVEPLSNYLVGRVRRDLRGGATVLGGMVTASHRDMAGGAFDDELRSAAWLVGVDGEHSWANRAWTLSGFVAASRVEGSAAAIETTQRSSAHYFQRPDADHLDLDPSRTSLTGWNGALALQHSGSWDGSVSLEQVSPGFEVNDLGFQSTADRRSLATFLGRRLNEPTGIFRSRWGSVYTTHAWNFDGDPVFHDVGSEVGATFTNLWSAGVGGGVSPEAYNDRLTRGGPLARIPLQWRAYTWVESDRRRTFSSGAEVFYREDESGEWDRSLELDFRLRPSSSILLSVSPGYARQKDTDQYVTDVEDANAAETFGTRYVFADIEQTELSLGTRLDWTFSPKLSLQLYAQPLVSTGRYSRFKEFAEPGAFEFDVYGEDRGTIVRGEALAGCGIEAEEELWLVDPDGAGPSACFDFDDPDFNFRSLRGNAVLRWEYRPGSAVFVVWQHLRSEEERFGDFDLGRDLRGILEPEAANVFMIKATYWLSR